MDLLLRLLVTCTEDVKPHEIRLSLHFLLPATGTCVETDSQPEDRPAVGSFWESPLEKHVEAQWIVGTLAEMEWRLYEGTS